MKNRDHTEKTQQVPEFCPPCSIVETGKDVILKVEMPGLSREDVGLELKGDELIITGKRHEEELPAGYATLLRERRAVQYRRSFTLNNIETEKMNAKYENGILTIALPKMEKLLPKKIAIS